MSFNHLALGLVGMMDYTILEWIDVALGCSVILILFILTLLFFKKKALIFFYSTSFILLLIGFVFRMTFFTQSVWMIVLMVGVVTMFFNLGPLREMLTDPFNRRKNNGNRGDAKAADTLKIPYNEKQFFADVNTAVLKLSATKTGAIMTFQKNMNLDPYLKNGTIIDAPFTPELVETIFYVGTRLHDGAIIVKKNIIVAASVYFRPSTKALTGKFGARHRAALGISEATDSVTVVCSEETGRISIAYNGKLESIRRDEFAVVFKEYMTM